MPLRGFKLVRFRGRYFTYESHKGGGLDQLGRLIVNQIPTDPTQYQEWLNTQRDFYNVMTSWLEAKILTITDQTCRNLDSCDIEYMPWQLLDDRLVELPSPLCPNLDPICRNYNVFLIDLDRGLFSVNMSVYFHLHNIPRQSWLEAVNQKAQARLFPRDRILPRACDVPRDSICPEAKNSPPPYDYFANNVSFRDYKANYQRYNCSVVRPRSGLKHESKSDYVAIVSTVLFAEFIDNYDRCFALYIPTWSHECFAFREFAFAILCFAAGEYSLDQPDRLRGDFALGFLTDPLIEEPPESMSNVVPVFPIGCHVLGKGAGSAPPTTIYWFHGVLVNLVPDHAMQNNLEALIAEVVETGLTQRK